MSTPAPSPRISPVLRAVDPNSPTRPIPKKAKSKSLSLPPFPRNLALSGPLSPAKRRNSARTDSLIMTSPRPTTPSQMLSPSKLPATDSMSYFPPFEDMGSATDGDDAQAPCEAGPSRPSSPSQGGSHGKNRSLGSLVTFMAWATFSPASETPPRPNFTASLSTGMIPSAPGLTDGECLQALTRRFASGHGKRRVLESIAMQEGTRGVSLLGLTTTRVNVEGEGVKQKRRIGSEMDVERMMRAGQAEMVGEDDEGDVERMIGWIPRPRIQRQNLSLPPNSLPNWRFPIPTPPIASLSPHIPVEFFEFEILNPASTSSSPTKPMSTFSDLHEEELDEIEGSLISIDSGSLSSTDSSLSDPTTPDRSPPRKSPHRNDPRFWTPTPGSSLAVRKSKSRFRVEGDDEDEDERGERMEMILPEKIKLRRTSSSGSKASCDSNATIKVREGEITPRLGKGWKAVEAAGGQGQARRGE